MARGLERLSYSRGPPSKGRAYPSLVGGGIPCFARGERPVNLELVESRTLGSAVLYLRYRVVR